MKKIAKLSLVAALAVTAANASSLEEAIKGVDISGNITYEYQDKKTKITGGTATDTSSQTNEYDAELTAKVPVNDMTKAIFKLDVTGDTTGDGADAKPTITMEDVYFSFTPGFATINAGKQNIPGPFTDGAQGSGIVALVPAGPVTVAAGYFNNHSVSSVDYNGSTGVSVTSKDATELALLGNFGPVSAEAWYADIQDTLDVYNLKASGSLGPVSVAAQYSELKEDYAGSKKDTEFNLDAEASFGMATVVASYAATGKDNNYGVAIDQDSDASATWALEQLAVVGMRAASIYRIGASFDVMANTNLAVDYATGDFKPFGTGTAKTDVDEILFTAKYAMSKNFNIRALYSMYEKEAAGAKSEDVDYGAIEFKYTF